VHNIRKAKIKGAEGMKNKDKFLTPRRSCCKITVLILSLFVLTALTATAQTVEDKWYDPVVTLKLSPGVGIPLGIDNDLFKLGGGALGSIGIHVARPLILSLDLGYSLAPLQTKRYVDLSESLSIVSVGAGPVLNLNIAPWFVINVFGKGGVFYAFLTDDTSTGGVNPWIIGGGGIYFRIVPPFSIGIEGSYRNYLGLYNDVNVTLGTAIHLGKARRREAPVKEKVEEAPVRPQPLTEEPVAEKSPEEKPPEQKPPAAAEGTLQIVKTEFDNIFPVFFKYYDKNPIGKAVIKNSSDMSVENLKVTFFVKHYMDNPKAAPAPERIEPGEEVAIDIYGLFNNNVLEITEGTKVSAMITTRYTLGGQEITTEHIETIRLNNRNAITWDDDRKAAAFVTSKDPAVMRFAKNVVGFIQAESNRALDKKLQIAMAIHEALDIFGITYVIDPTTPYIEFSGNELAIDYLQFPKQTLEFLAGDCDDLSILYSALLESAGVETAFITVPGHIYMAFALDMSPDEARKTFLYPDELIFREGKVWVPVEITLRQQGFLKAWQEGAKQWRENAPKDQVGFYPMHDAWKLYEPVGFPGTPVLTYPGRDDVVASFKSEASRFIEREIYPQVARIQGDIAASGGSPRDLNRLGVLYARYGLDDRAKAEFEKALEKEDYVPALINLGNLSFIKKDMQSALSYYQRAQKILPDNPNVLLSIARVNHEIENYATARQAYARLREVSPTLAARFAYLDLRGEEASRAAEAAGLKEVVVWTEE